MIELKDKKELTEVVKKLQEKSSLYWVKRVIVDIEESEVK